MKASKDVKLNRNTFAQRNRAGVDLRTFTTNHYTINKKHIDASVKERPQTLLVSSEEIYKRVLCNKHI